MIKNFFLPLLCSFKIFFRKIFNRIPVFSHIRPASALTRFASGEAGALLLSGNYLYAAIQGKLCTFDVSIPDKPRLIAQTGAAGNRQMVQAGNFLYLTFSTVVIQDSQSGNRSIATVNFSVAKQDAL